LYTVKSFLTIILFPDIFSATINREIMDKTNDNANGNNMILTRVGSSVEVVNLTKEIVKVTNSTESQFTSVSNFTDSNKKKCCNNKKSWSSY
jgi:hypothetical protein